MIDLNEDGLDHIMADQLKIGLPDQVSNVFLAAGEEIVHAYNLRPPPVHHKSESADHRKQLQLKLNKSILLT